MKIFIDTANIEHIKEFSYLVDGVTTNPSLIAKEGREFKTVVKEICSIINGPISAEVISLKADEMVKEATPLSKLHKNIVIKIPMTEEGLKAIKQLSKLNIKTNCTLVFSLPQAVAAAKAGATYVSPFVGRLDDKGENGMRLVEEIVTAYKHYHFKTKIIVASIRNIDHIIQSALLGADIATIPYKVLKDMLRHELTDIGIKKFLDDWKTVKKR